MKKEIAGLSIALDRIYDAALDPAIWPDALQKIADCFGDVGTVILFQRNDGTTGNIVSPKLVDAQRDFNQHWSDKDIRGQRAFERGLFLRSDAITDRHVVTPEEIETHPIYTDFNAKHGLGWVAGVSILPDPRTPVWLSVQRAKSKPQFSEDELDLIVLLGRHAENSLRIGMRLITNEAISSNIADVLSDMDCGIVVLDGQEKPLFQNEAATHALSEGLYLKQALRKRDSSRKRPTDTRAVGSMKSTTHVSVDLNPVIVDRTIGGSLVFFFLPFRQSQPAHLAALFSHAETIVLILDLQLQTNADPSILRSVLGLTLAEARVAAGVGAGRSPRKTAESLGVTEETVRKVLKNVFAKTGVHRQSELALLMSRLSLVKTRA